MSEESYYLKFGTRRLRMMRFIEKENGEQMVIFHLHGGGFHITKHPLGANPHMVNKKTGFRRELDLRALRGHDWNADLPGFQRAFESLFYWPAHRADLIAFPGPPGKTWVRAFEDVCKGPDLDIMEYLRLVLGYGTLFKVGYRDRKKFFDTDLGKGSLIWDKKERRLAFWVGGPFPERPLFSIRPEDGPFFVPMPKPLEEWRAALDYETKIGAEEFFEAREEEFERLAEEIAPELEEFMSRFQVIRWMPSLTTAQVGRCLG